MSLLITRPDAWTTAPCRLEGIGSGIAEVDEASALTATQFSAHAASYQMVGAPAMAVHEPFIALLRTSAGSYAGTGTVNTISAS